MSPRALTSPVTKARPETTDVLLNWNRQSQGLSR